MTITNDRRVPPPPPPPPPVKAKGTDVGTAKGDPKADTAKADIAKAKPEAPVQKAADAKTVASKRTAALGAEKMAQQAQMAKLDAGASKTDATPTRGLASDQQLTARQGLPESPAEKTSQRLLDGAGDQQVTARQGLPESPAETAQGVLKGGDETATANTATPVNTTSTPADDATKTQLRDGFAKATQDLANKDPKAFDAIAEQAFGDKGAKLGDQARDGSLPQPQNVQFVERAALQGASGAYSADNGGTVYLANDLKGKPGELQKAYNEESAHHLDQTLGGPDSKGDEGEIFSKGLEKGGPLGAEALEAAKTQKDTSTVTIDGKEMQVENRFSAGDIFNLATSAASWIPGAGDAVALGSAAVNAATGNYGAALMDIISLVPGVGDAIGSAGKLLLQNRLGREAAGELLKGLQKYGPKLRSGIQSALNKAKKSGLISAKQHRDLSTTLKAQLDLVTNQAKKAAGKPKAKVLPKASARPWTTKSPTNSAQRTEATKNGWSETNGSGVASHGQLVFKDKKGNFYSADVDDHSGGTWKKFDRSAKRTGTLDRTLNRIKK